ncbi:hypothetical protein IE02_2243 [Fibrobacter succinogenes subsp. elongatus]|uniref:Uncharacterized protein n=1 Tax=Fibrobacter succinogenes TaxID=833 RepID=A0A380S6I1_FIBSU|nr:hypothetical protein IE02_2243 [Fibrobacter succinogenes subsp. elongatus]SUQ24829.1 hypothetical protein SAMN05661053_2243 [Fibrobacter succinogenes]
MLITTAGYHTLQHNKHKRPTPHRDVSARLILVLIESGSFSCENKRRISKISVAPNHSVRNYVNCNIDYWNDKRRRLLPSEMKRRLVSRIS